MVEKRGTQLPRQLLGPEPGRQRLIKITVLIKKRNPACKTSLWLDGQGFSGTRSTERDSPGSGVMNTTSVFPAPDSTTLFVSTCPPHLGAVALFHGVQRFVDQPLAVPSAFPLLDGRNEQIARRLLSVRYLSHRLFLQLWQ